MAPRLTDKGIIKSPGTQPKMSFEALVGEDSKARAVRNVKISYSFFVYAPTLTYPNIKLWNSWTLSLVPVMTFESSGGPVTFPEDQLQHAPEGGTHEWVTNNQHQSMHY